MSQSWEKVYIFISSTFNDMHAERDFLVKKVFPKLSEWCERRNIHMVDIDLRWGVTEADATLNKNVVEVCLRRIDECRPFFICFLGQRRGWVPGATEISPETFDSFPELKSYAGKASITEIEILHALIKPLHGESPHDHKKPEEYYEHARHAFFYLREDSYLSHMPPYPSLLRQIYTNDLIIDPKERHKADTELRNWREDKIPGTKRPVTDYKAEWKDTLSTPEISMPLQCPSESPENIKRWQSEWQKHALVKVTGLDVEEDRKEAEKAREFNKQLIKGRLTDFNHKGEKLEDVIFNDLKTAIENDPRFKKHREIEYEDEFQKELDQQEQFVFINSEGFIQRTGDFDDLDEYVRSNSQNLFVLTAEGGMGKSMLLANWVSSYKGKLNKRKNETLHYRFIGASDGSTNVHSLLRLLLMEIKEISEKIEDAVEEVEEHGVRHNKTIQAIPDDPIKLRNRFPEILRKIGAKGKTVIVIDALNQLESGLSDLSWLPRQLPDSIKLIVSFKRGKKVEDSVYKSFIADERVHVVETKPFEDGEDRRRLIQAYLNQYLKELDQRHILALIKSPGADNPLFLKVLLSELRVFGSFENLTNKILSDFGDSPVSAFKGVLHRLEHDPSYSPIDPKHAVPLIFGLMSHARHGLSADELATILVQVLGKEGIKINKEDAFDTVYLFLRQVRPFLARRDGRYDFFYESFKNAGLKRFVSEVDELPRRTTQSWHKLLADYFYRLPLRLDNTSGDLKEEKKHKKPNRRKVAELPYHLINAEDWKRIEEVLCDLYFIEAKCAAGMTYELIIDYNIALDDLPYAQEEKDNELKHQDRLRKYTEDLIAYAKGEIKELDIIPSVRPWTDEEIREEIERIISNPTQLDRIRAFSQFINSESHSLMNFGEMPGLCVQQAYNTARSGPVPIAAEDIIKNDAETTFLLRRPHQRPELNPHPCFIRTLQQHTSWVTSVCIPLHSGRVVSGGWDQSIRLWNMETGECLFSLDGQLEEINSLDISTDGRMLVSGGWGRVVQVWDMESRSCLFCLEGHTDWINTVSIAPDRSIAVSGSRDRSIRIWDLEKGQEIRKLSGHMGSVQSTYILAGRHLLVSGSQDHSLGIWDLSNGECLQMLKGHTEGVESVSATPDGKIAVSGSRDYTVRVWDMERGECIKVLNGHSKSVESVCITPDGKIVVSGGQDCTVRVWDVERGECIKVLNGHSESVESVCITPDGRTAVSASQDFTLKIWNIVTGIDMPMMEKHTAAVESVDITPDGRKAVSGGRDWNVKVWDVQKGELHKTLNGHENIVKSACISPCGKRAVSGSWDQTIVVWNLEAGKLLISIKGNRLDFDHLCLSLDGKEIIDRALHKWDLDSGECLQSFNSQIMQSGAFEVAPDGESVATGCTDNFIRIWKLESGKNLRVLEGHKGEVTSISIAPDLKRAVSGSKDRTMKVWDLQAGKCIGTIEGHTDEITSVSIMPNTMIAVSGGWDRTLRVWNLESRECIAVLPTSSEVISLSRIGAGGHFACGTDGGEVILLTIQISGTHPRSVTPVRYWTYDGEDGHGRWEDDVKAFCCWCGGHFRLPADIFGVTEDIAEDSDSFNELSTCFSLPVEAWDEPHLLFNCPDCHNPLKSSPFFVDNRYR